MPHGTKDRDLELLRTDSPSMKPEVLRSFCAFAVDLSYEVKSMDIKTAFLQTRPLEREFFVVPPKVT